MMTDRQREICEDLKAALRAEIKNIISHDPSPLGLWEPRMPVIRKARSEGRLWKEIAADYEVEIGTVIKCCIGFAQQHGSTLTEMFRKERQPNGIRREP